MEVVNMFYINLSMLLEFTGDEKAMWDRKIGE